MNTPEPTPSDLANGLRHAADDHPCCASVLLASAELIDRLEAREAARVTDGVPRLVRLCEERKETRESLAFYEQTRNDEKTASLRENLKRINDEIWEIEHS